MSGGGGGGSGSSTQNQSGSFRGGTKRTRSSTPEIVDLSDVKQETDPKKQRVGSGKANLSNNSQCSKLSHETSRRFSSGNKDTPLAKKMDKVSFSKTADIIDQDVIDDSSEGEPLMVRPTAPQPAKKADQLFIEKYRPKTIDDIVGNEKAVGGFRLWLENWVRVFVKGEDALTETGRKSRSKDVGKKAALLSGPPGIGKTSSAHAVAKTLGFEVVEINASISCAKSTLDNRKGIGSRITNIVREQSTNQMIQGKGIKVSHVIVMDEVDGIPDRGAVGDIIDIIKKSKIPVICICNDKWMQKLKSLRGHCVEFDFQLPRQDQVVARMKYICQQEGVQIDDGGLVKMYQRCEKDLRVIMGWIQSFKGLKDGKVITAAMIDEIMKSGGKDVNITPFDATRKILDKSLDALKIDDRLDLVMSDLDFVPLLLQENYVKFNPVLSQGKANVRIKCCAKAATAMVTGDIMSSSMRKLSNWSLYPSVGLVAGVYPAVYMRGEYQHMQGVYDSTGGINFSSWFGKNSSRKKNVRLANELFSKLVAAGLDVTDVSTMISDYLPFLRLSIVEPIVEYVRAQKFDQALELLRQYCITMEDMEFIVDVTSSKANSTNPYQSIPAQTKTAFTRFVTKSGGLIPKTTNMAEEAVRIGKGSRGTASGSKKKKSVAADEAAEFEAIKDPDVIQEDKLEDVVDDSIDVDEAMATLQSNKDIVFERKGAGKGSGSGKSSGSARSSATQQTKHSKAGSGRGRGRGRGKGNS